MVAIKKLLLFLCLFFLFNILEIDSNSDKILFYDRDSLYDESDYTVYFKNISNKELENVLNLLDIEVLSYIIDGEKYYSNSLDELANDFLINKSLSEELYYNEYGISIDGIHILCTSNELLKLENLTDIY